MQAVTGPERVVAGRYQLLGWIGQGAMGTVWRAKDLVLTREVAVKEVRLPHEMADHERRVLRERTLREARVSAKLSHPGVVTVYDVIEADGTAWIVMELVAARSLDKVVAEDGPLPPRRAAETGVMLVGALASAHAAGIVHRDVKPGNVLITCDGRAVLTDFGIATLDGDPGLTQTGMVMGTPGFCAPERIRGEPASPASDMWSLGATLYAAVEGRGPFDGQGSPMAVLASIVHSDPPPARSAGPLGTVIGALLSKDPARRPDAACATRLLISVAAAPGPLTSTTGAGRIPASAGPVPTRADPLPASAGRVPTKAGSLPASAGPVPTRAGPLPASARLLPAGAGVGGSCARTDPTGFPAGPGPAGPANGPGPLALPGTEPDGFLPGRAPRPPAGGTGTAQFPAGGGPGRGGAASAGDRTGVPDAHRDEGFFPPGTGPASFPGGADPVIPAGAGPAPLPASLGAVPFPGGAGPAGPRNGGARPAGRPRARPSAGRRVLTLGLAGAAIIVAGLIAGLVWSRVTGPSPGSRSTGAGSSGTAAAAPLPAGYRWYARPTVPAGNAAGFRVAVPVGWQARRRGTTAYLRNPASGSLISVSPAPTAASGPLGDARMLEQAALSRRSLAGYRRIAIMPFQFRGNPAGAWRFTYRQPGTGAMDGLAVVAQESARGAGRQPYEFMATAPAGSWLPTKAAFAEAIRTFSPRG